MIGVGGGAVDIGWSQVWSWHLGSMFNTVHDVLSSNREETRAWEKETPESSCMGKFRRLKYLGMYST